MIASYEKRHGLRSGIRLSEREAAVLGDLYHGLSRREIAVKQELSIHTVNSAVGSVFSKLGANNIIDVVRVAAEERLVNRPTV